MRRAFLGWAFIATVSVGISMHASAAGAQGTAEVRVERAPDGSLRGGVVDVPGWVVWAAAGTLALGALGGLGWRLRRAA